MRALVKICGICSVNDALAAAEAGADWIGLNFWEGSKRRVDKDVARAIVNAVGGRVVVVGVFVNSPINEVGQTAEFVGLNRVQFHGDEGPEYFERFGKQAIGVVRVANPGDLEKIAPHPAPVVLLDAHVDGFGGQGKSFDWDWLSPRPAKPFVLAGGLNPINVADAVRLTRPLAVDVASGVENEPGVKDHHLMRAFVAAAKQRVVP